MQGRLAGKVAFISGAARGQGRAHAVRLASEGADIVAFDLPSKAVEWLGYRPSTPEDLAETVRAVEALDRRIVAMPADVRDAAALAAVAERAMAQFGRIDIVVANAGIGPIGHRFWEIPDEVWQDTIDINLTGVWRTVSAAIPHVIAGGEGGSVIVTSSAAAMKGAGNVAAYTSAKLGLIGMVQTMARELAPHLIRANAVAPTSVRTEMIINDATFQLFRPDLEAPTLTDALRTFQRMNLMPVPLLEPEDIAATVAFLASDDARAITGTVVPVDLGGVLK